MMDGEIGFTSEEGKGSTFWFTVELANQVKDENMVYRQSNKKFEPEGIRVLTIDDNGVNRLVIGDMLDAIGVRHDEVANAAEALELIKYAGSQKDPYMLGFCDMDMPDMNGEELGRLIREQEESKSMRLVMLTSLGKRGDVRRLENIGFSGYLTKPVKRNLLEDCIISVMREDEAGKHTYSNKIVTRHLINEERRKDIRVLLAEDNVFNQQVAQGILGKLGYCVDVVANGNEAIKALENISYSIVLMDVQMPDMDGYEATRIIRSPGSGVRNHDVPIIALTAHAMQGDREKCLEAGMDDYIPKPVTKEDIAGILLRWLPDENVKGSNGMVSYHDDIREMNVSKQTPELETAIFNRDAFYRRISNDADLIVELIHSFRKTMPEQIENLKNFIEEGDAIASSKQAHSIKGAVLNMGGEALGEVARKMEIFGKNENLKEMRSLLPDIIKQYELLEKELIKIQE